VDGSKFTQGLRVEADPTVRDALIAAEQVPPPKKRSPGPEDD
jgi:hypothetical protein